MNAKQLLRTIYLNMYKNGSKEISLKPNDLLLQILKIEEVFEKYNIDSDDLFIKTPVLETYDKYIDYLISIFLGEHLGYMNERYDSIIIKCPMYKVEKELEQMKDYIQIINECCNIITDDIPKRNMKRLK